MKKQRQIKANPPNQPGTCGAECSAAAGAEAGEEASSETALAPREMVDFAAKVMDL